MQLLKQSTEIKVRVGPFVSSLDAVTPDTSVTLGDADVAALLKDDGAAVVDLSGATWAAVANAAGWYDLTLTDAHTDTRGLLEVIVQSSEDYCPVHVRFMVIDAAIWGVFFEGDGVPTEGVTTEQVRAEMDASLDAYEPPTLTQLNAAVAGLNDLSAAETAAAVWDALLESYEAAGSFGAALGGLPDAGANADALLDRALSGHLTAGTAGRALSRLDKTLSEMESNIRGLGAHTLESLSDQVSGLGEPDLTASGIASAVWDRLLSGHDTEGSAGEALARLDQPLSETEAAIRGADDEDLSALMYTLNAVAMATGVLGELLYVYTVTEKATNIPIPNAVVRVSEDPTGELMLAAGRTNFEGKVIFHLDPGTYFFWRQHPEFVFDDPDIEAVY